MSVKWDKSHPELRSAQGVAWRRKHPKYMSDYKHLLKLYEKGKIKLEFGERIMDYRWMLKLKP